MFERVFSCLQTLSRKYVHHRQYFTLYLNLLWSHNHCDIKYPCRNHLSNSAFLTFWDVADSKAHKSKTDYWLWRDVQPFVDVDCYILRKLLGLPLVLCAKL